MNILTYLAQTAEPSTTDALTSNPNLFGVIALLISTLGTAFGLWLNYSRDKKNARREEVKSLYERQEEYEKKLDKANKIIEEQAEVIRKLKDDKAELIRTVKEKNAEIIKRDKKIAELEGRIIKLERKTS